MMRRSWDGCFPINKEIMEEIEDNDGNEMIKEETDNENKDCFFTGCSS